MIRGLSSHRCSAKLAAGRAAVGRTGDPVWGVTGDAPDSDTSVATECAVRRRFHKLSLSGTGEAGGGYHPAVPSVPWRPAPKRRHHVVCGDDPLAHRLVEELATRYGEDVTVIVPSKRRNHGPQISRLPGVRVIESERLDEEAFRAARLASAHALALVRQDDVGNIHAALRAQELNRGLRLVIRMFNMNLGHGVRVMFDDCLVLSDAGMAAPAFVAAALGEVAPSHIRLPGRTLFVAKREDVAADHVVCGLADTSAPGGPDLLPEPQDRADLVLAVANS